MYRVVVGHKDLESISGTGIDPEYILDILHNCSNDPNPMATTFEFDLSHQYHMVDSETFVDAIHTYAIRILWENGWNKSDICMYFVQRYVPFLDKWENLHI